MSKRFQIQLLGQTQKTIICIHKKLEHFINLVLYVFCKFKFVNNIGGWNGLLNALRPHHKL